LQSVVDANSAQSTLPSDCSPSASRFLEQNQIGPEVIQQQPTSLLETAPRGIPVSISGNNALSESTHSNTLSYQARILPETSNQSYSTVPAGPAGQSLSDSTMGRFPKDGTITNLTADSCRIEPLTPVSQQRIDEMETSVLSSYDNFQQPYTLAQPRTIGSVSLGSDQVCQLFKAYVLLVEVPLKC
jgi:hypothetical protein